MEKINLNKLIKEAILKKKGISLSEYMKMCMTHPKYGYYTKQYPIGFKGDFITSPEISQMFGEIIAVDPAKELYLDWSNLTQTGTGNPIDLLRIDRLVLAGFRQDLGMLEDDFLRTRSLAEKIIEVNVAGIQAIPFSRIEDFDEFDLEYTWLLALECSLCLNPAPFFVGVVTQK